MTDRDGDWEIFTMKANGKKQKRVSRNQVADLNPAWSPDGKKIAFHRDNWL